MDKENKRKGSWFGSLMGMMFGEKVSRVSLLEEEQVQSPMKTMVKEFFRRKLTIVGLVGFSTMLIASTIIPIFFPLDLRGTDPGQVNQRPSMNMMSIPNNIRNDLYLIASGSGFGVGVTNDHRIHVWGTVSTIAEPILNPPQPGRPIAHLSAGPYHALAVTEDGYVYVWGNEAPSFEIMNIPAGIQGRVVYAEAGMRMTVAITDDGRIHAWGGVAMLRREVAATHRLPSTETAVQVESNVLTFGVLTDAGEVYVLMQTPRGIRYVPEEIQGQIIDFAMSDDGAAAVLRDGTVVTWGAATDLTSMIVPDELQGRVTAISAGREHFTVILDDGSVASWGDNAHGRTDAPRVTNAEFIAVGGDHNYVMTADGTIHTWGLRGFLFGTDQNGRCVWTRLWSGGRYSLLIGMVAVIVQGFIGLILGGLAGYYGGKLDMFIMRLGEVVGSLPFLPLAVILQFRFRDYFGDVGGMAFLMIVLGILTWPALMRLVRAQILQVKESEYVLGARALGVRQFKIIFRHIMPNVISVAIVLLTLALASSMLTESALSFIGFGVSEPTPTWGNMLVGSNNSIVLRDQWWRWLFPAVALVTTAISINLIGDGLREATDPRSQGR